MDRQEPEKVQSPKTCGGSGVCVCGYRCNVPRDGILFLQNHIDASDEQAIAAACPKVDVTIQYTGGEQQVILNKENVNGVIRKEEVGNMASATSVYPVVRTKLVELQRQLAAKENVIMDGRDIGTVVLPDANVKIYLTASSKVRAKRRFDELTAKGVSCDMDAIEKILLSAITGICTGKLPR